MHSKQSIYVHITQVSCLWSLLQRLPIRPYQVVNSSRCGGEQVVYFVYSGTTPKQLVKLHIWSQFVHINAALLPQPAGIFLTCFDSLTVKQKNKKIKTNKQKK